MSGYRIFREGLIVEVISIPRIDNTAQQKIFFLLCQEC